jgi:hypothetical protein
VCPGFELRTRGDQVQNDLHCHGLEAMIECGGPASKIPIIFVRVALASVKNKGQPSARPLSRGATHPPVVFNLAPPPLAPPGTMLLQPLPPLFQRPLPKPL